MPYVRQAQRFAVDADTEDLACTIMEIGGLSPEKMAGLVNYAITRLLLRTILQTVCYSNIALATGVLENIKQEMYRRLAAPYEDVKAEENGDVYE